MSILFTFNKVLSNVVALHSHLVDNVGTAFKFVNYIPTANKIVVATELQDYVSENILEQTVTNAINSYSDISTGPKGGIQTGSTVKMDSYSSYSGNSVKVLNNLDLQTNKIINLSDPTSGLDAANKNYVDAISAGDGLSKDVGPVFNINTDNSLGFDQFNNLRIATGALGTGLSGGSGALISVNTEQPQITKVGTLTSLTVTGNLIASSGLNVSSNKIINVANPTSLNDAANKYYVDNTIQFSAGNGLISSGTLLSVNVDTSSIEIANDMIRVSPNFVGAGLSGGGSAQITINPNQPRIVSLGTLTGLTVEGATIITNTSDSSSSDSGALQIAGGIGISKSATILGNLYVGNGINTNMKNISNVAIPISANDAANKDYVDSLVTTAGAGMVKSGTTLTANVDAVSIEISPTNRIRIASGAVGTGLSGGSGNVLSVISDQSQVTKVGTLTALQVSGIVSITNSINVTTANTGSLQLAGGMFVGQDSFIAGSERISGMLTVSGITTTVSQVYFTNTLDASSYNTGSFIVSGGASFAKTVQMAGSLSMNSTRITSVAAPVNTGDATNKGYVDSNIVTAGSGISKSGTAVSVVVNNASIEISSNTLRVASTFAGTGLTGGSGNSLSVNASQPQITSVGMLSALSVNGLITAYSGINVNNAKVTGLATPTANSDATNKLYVDTNRPVVGSGLVYGSSSSTSFDVNVDNISLQIAGNVVRIASGALGTGLTGGSGSTISVVPNQSQVTSVGTLTGLTIAASGTTLFANTTNATSSTSGPNAFSGGVSIAKSLYVGQNVTGLGTLTLTGAATFLNDTVFSGPMTAVHTADSIDPSSGSFVTVGGLGVAKSISTGGKIYMPNSLQLSTTAVTGVRGFKFSNADAVNPEIRISIENSETGSDYVSLLRLFSLGNTNVANREYLEFVSTSGTSHIRTAAVGTGLTHDILLNTGVRIKPDGQVVLHGTLDATSTTTGALTISSGGLSVAASAVIGGSLIVTNGVDVNMKRITNVANPTDIYDAVNLGHLQNAIQGFSVKHSVMAATTGPIIITAITPGSTLDGHTLALNERILVKDQNNDPRQNGIYVVTVSGAVRSADLATGSNGTGVFVFVESGTINAASGWINSTPGATDIVGTDPLAFQQFSAAGQIIAGSAMSKSGNILDVVVDNVSLEIVDDALRIKSTAIGTGLSGGSGVQITVNSDLPHVVGLGTVTTGTWNANTITVGNGGTGLTSLPAGRVLYGNGSSSIGNTAGFTYVADRLTSSNMTLTGTTVSTSPTTGSLIVGGGAGIAGDLYVNGNVTLTGVVTVPTPMNGTDAVTKSYVDTNLSTAGTGLTKTGTSLSVNAVQTQIITLGTLTSVSTTGTISTTNITPSTSVTTGSIVSPGGLGIGGAAYIGGTLQVAGTSTLSGTVIVPITPTLAGHAASKSYVDSLISTAGIGLTKTGNVFSVNAVQTQITSVGTLTGLSSSGNIAITSGTNSTGVANGALVVTGGMGISANLNVGGTAVFSSTITVPTPSNATDASNKAYVDSLISTAGTGLTKTGNVFSVNVSQTQITSIGTLSALTVSGLTRVTNTTMSTSSSTGAFVVTGGTGIGGALYVSGATNLTTLNASGATTLAGISSITNTTTSTSTTSGAFIVSGGVGISGSTFIGVNLSVNGTTNLVGSVTVPTPVGTTDAVNKGYTDGLTYLTAGIGLTKTGSTLSVNSSQTQIVTLGTVTGLTSSGIVNVTNTTVSTSTTTGALQVAGGAGFVGSVFIGANLSVSGNSVFTGTTTVPTPVNATDAVSKGYTDGLSYVIAGIGLTKTSATLSVNSSQSQITSVGTLTGLTSSGNVNITNTTISTSATTGALQVAGGVGITGSVYIDNNLTINGTITVSTPVNATDAATKAYTDGLSYLTAGTGLTKSGSTLSVNAGQSQITSLGTLIGLTSSGIINVTNTTISTSSTSGSVQISGGVGIAGSVYIATNLNVNGATVHIGSVTVPTPVGATDAVTKAYTDGLSYVTAGIGLTRTGATLSINASQTQITSVGTLNGLTSSGVVNITNTTASSSSITGSLQVAGGIGVAGSVYIASNLNVTGSTVHVNSVTVPTPVNATDAVTKAYVDSNLALAGTGLTKTGVTLSVNPSQTQITSVGTLTSLGVSGNTTLTGSLTAGSISIIGTADSTSIGTGALILSGGLSVAKNITANTVTVAGGMVLSVFSNGSWINLPTSGPSGIGTGGPGANCFIGYAQGAGNWFTNAAAGDVCYRNASGRILFGNTANTFGMSLSGDVLTVASTADATTIATGAFQVLGGGSITKSLTIGGKVQLQSTNNTNTVSIDAPAAVTTSHTMHLPPAPPTSNGQFVLYNTDGTGSFNTPAVSQVLDGVTPVNGCKWWQFTGVVSGGSITCYPTSDNTSTGTALFSVILIATAMSSNNTTTPRSAPLCSLRSISADRKTIIFNVVIGTTASLGQPTIVAATNGFPVTVMVMGY